MVHPVMRSQLFANIEEPVPSRQAFIRANQFDGSVGFVAIQTFAFMALSGGARWL